MTPVEVPSVVPTEIDDVPDDVPRREFLIGAVGIRLLPAGCGSGSEEDETPARSEPCGAPGETLFRRLRAVESGLVFEANPYPWFFAGPTAMSLMLDDL